MKKQLKSVQNKKTKALIFVVGFAVVGAIILIFANAATPTASFSLTPSASSVPIGTDVTVGVYEDSLLQSINAVSVKMSYNSSQLTFKTISLTGSAFSGCLTTNGSDASGTVDLVCYMAPPNNLSGKKLIANVVFTAKTGSGTSSIAFVKESATNSRIALSGTGENIWDSVTTGTTLSLTTPDTTVPAVSISAPAGGAVLAGASTVTATASDASGINKVEFYTTSGGVDTLRSTDTTSPYSFSWDTTLIADGAYSIKAKAFDNASPTNSAVSTPVAVTVVNKKPDLVVLSVNSLPVAPSVGDSVTLSAVIKNNGTAAIAAGTVNAISFIIDSSTTPISTQNDTAALAIGESRTITSTVKWTAVLGSHTVNVTTDKNNVIGELSESNNTATQTTVTYTKGDSGLTPGKVDLDDLLAVINNWNKTSQTRDKGELTNSDNLNIVNLDDLLAVINNWKP